MAEFKILRLLYQINNLPNPETGINRIKHQGSASFFKSNHSTLYRCIHINQNNFDIFYIGVVDGFINRNYENQIAYYHDIENIEEYTDDEILLLFGSKVTDEYLTKDSKNKEFIMEFMDIIKKKGVDEELKSIIDIDY